MTVSALSARVRWLTRLARHSRGEQRVLLLARARLAALTLDRVVSP